MSLKTYVNHFKEEDFEPRNGRSVLIGAPSRYYETLTLFEDDGYDVEFAPVTAGRHPNGIAFFVGTLTLTRRIQGAVEGEGTVQRRTVVSCAAEGESPEMGIAGVQTTALGNALLRGLGMAAFLYENNEPPAPTPYVQPQAQFSAPAGQPAHQYQQPNKGGGYNRRSAPAGDGYNNQGGGQRQGGGGRNYGPWDGTKVIQSGKYANQPYSAVRMEDLQKWASGDNPNGLAIKEIERRMGQQGQPDMGGAAFGNGYSY